VTRYYCDALRRLVATRDPLGRVIGQEWCACGSLDALLDANGHRTRWERDLEGRVTREVRADDVTATTYTYTYGSASGRLATMTDPKGQVTTYTYALDNAILSTVYTNAQMATPSVTYTYDAQYGRVATMTDGTGVTTYTYHPAGVPGAGQVAAVDGPLTDDTITYSYDQLGRVTTRAINGAANAVTWAFDALGRVTSETNVLGTFSYTYDGVSGRVAAVTYPNGQTSAYTYLDNTHDRRLGTIHHKYPSGDTLSRFDYTYDVVGNILTWRQQADTTAVMWGYGYDVADQLTWAVEKTTDPVPTVIKSYTYGYDPAGNRTTEQIDDQVTGATYDMLNRLVSQQPAGAMVVEGTVSEPASLTVQGKPVFVAADGRFSTTTPFLDGTNTLTLTATDASGNATSNQYEVDSTGAGRTFTYDANGNLTSDGTRGFEWDAKNQLVGISYGSYRSEFTYDGLQQRVRIIEAEGAIVDTDTRVLWCGTAICEERASNGATVTRRAFAQSEQTSSSFQFLATDHLDSVRVVTNNTGALLAGYAFDPWGRRTVMTGADVTTVGFTGHRSQARSGVQLTLYRAYDPELGRWLSEDPIRFSAGPNYYAYVEGRTTISRDDVGLAPSGGCCETLRKRYRRVNELIDDYEAGRPPRVGPGGLSYGDTTCAEIRLPNGGMIGIPDTRIDPSTPSCLRECVVAHENRHQQQCRRFGIKSTGTNASERSGYLVELGCLIRKLRDNGCNCSQ